MKHILFVCLGNICRSPTAEAVFRQRVQQRHLEQQIRCDSAGTSREHSGEAPDPRAVAAARRRGYDMSSLRARQVRVEDFEQFDLVLAMDKQNLANLQRLAGPEYRHKLKLFLSFADGDANTNGDSTGQEVPDPYYGGPDGFDHVLDLVENASDGLLDHLTGSAAP